MNIQSFIKRHPVPTFFALTFAISWADGVTDAGCEMQDARCRMQDAGGARPR